MNESIIQIEEEKHKKIDLRNRALKDYEIYYSEYRDVKEQENLLDENLKKKMNEESQFLMSVEYLKQQILYKDQEFEKLLDEQKNLKSSIEEIIKGKNIFNRSINENEEQKEENINIEEIAAKKKKKDEKIVEEEKKYNFC